RSGRDRRHFQVWGGGFIATGADEGELHKAMDDVRYRVAFYGSTRSYRPVLSAHGWDDLGNELHRMSVQGEWGQMAAKVPDELVHAFAACATHRDLPAAVEKRFGGLTDAIGLGFAKDTPEGLVRELVADLRRIPSVFQGFATSWD
ncbi:MAG TPA: LLM class F420-dependent oxidoreductase, partial [Myxococcota bacterium]|nr:LLM class F420-dependent oxidoreductase [Myxococcota bacterium]